MLEPANALHDGGTPGSGSVPFDSSVAFIRVTRDSSRIKDIGGNVDVESTRANCESRGPTCKDKPVRGLFRRNRRQRACWWWSRARREVVVCLVGLVVDGSGHCIELKLKLGGCCSCCSSCSSW